ncbi:MFS transporter [Flexivirga caeni]|nr:MFS transporter [Flexivirga caeni]
MNTVSAPTDRRADLHIARRLAPSQALYVFGSSVDLTLTGIVGNRLAPGRDLATLPFSLISAGTVVSTFLVSRLIGRHGYRAVFVTVAGVALIAGVISAMAVQTGSFWLFCLGTCLIGVYNAGAGYYRYAAADASGGARAAAITTVLAGGLVAALIGPFLATWAAHVLPVVYVASYLLVAVLGGLAAVWNSTLPGTLAEPPAGTDSHTPIVGARSRTELWQQPALLAGVATTAFAAVTMGSMMTAGPIAGVAMGHTASEAAFAVQLHMIGMFAPGFLVARVIDRLGERIITVTGVALVFLAGAAAIYSTATWSFLTAMLAVGVGWNLAYSGGSAMIAASYRRAERGKVQPVAEAITGTFQVIGSLTAGLLATVQGWRVLGIGVILLCIVLTATITALGRAAE